MSNIVRANKFKKKTRVTRVQGSVTYVNVLDGNFRSNLKFRTLIGKCNALTVEVQGTR